MEVIKLNGSNFLKGAALGLIAGAVTAILLAPKSGKETREDIKDFSEETMGKFMDKLSGLKNLTKDKFDDISKDFLEEHDLKIDDDKKDEVKNELKKCFVNIKKTLES
jgi:gas vesicle protein